MRASGHRRGSARYSRSMAVVSAAEGRAQAAGTDRADRLSACVERARGGERAALDEVVRELNPLLWHVARAQGLGTEEAADVVQTAWLELLRGLGEIRSSQALTAWLVTVTRREAGHGRARTRRQMTDALAGLAAGPGPRPQPHEGGTGGEPDQGRWAYTPRAA